MLLYYGSSSYFRCVFVCLRMLAGEIEDQNSSGNKTGSGGGAVLIRFRSVKDAASADLTSWQQNLDQLSGGQRTLVRTVYSCRAFFVVIRPLRRACFLPWSTNCNEISCLASIALQWALLTIRIFDGIAMCGACNQSIVVTDPRCWLPTESRSV